jgi:hypothetical protein
MISAPASRLPIADVVKGVFKLLAGDGGAVLPRAFARRHLAQVVVRAVYNLAEPTLQSSPLQARSAAQSHLKPPKATAKPPQSHILGIY